LLALALALLAVVALSILPLAFQLFVSLVFLPFLLSSLVDRRVLVCFAPLPLLVGLLLASFLVFVVSLPRLALVWLLVLVLVLALVISSSFAFWLASRLLAQPRGFVSGLVVIPCLRLLLPSRLRERLSLLFSSLLWWCVVVVFCFPINLILIVPGFGS
jgi:hypothetical protein